MYMSRLKDVHVPHVKKRWTVASARQSLPKLLALAAREPQAVYRRDKLVATVVSPALAEEIEAARARDKDPGLANELAELQRLCAEEGYELPTPRRANRPLSARGRKR
jgi:hypothetical protein